MINVVVADDHPLIREGVKQALSHEPEIRVIGEAGSGPELENALRRTPDVLLLDIGMPDFEVLRQVPELRTRYPEMKIVIVTAFESEIFAQRLMGDVHGYLLKAEGMDAYARAVQAVSRGRKYYSERAIELAFNSPEVPKLSPRELDVLKLAAHGLKTAEIAERLFISSRTVETHVDNAMDKLVVRNRTAAVAKAIELGLISTGMREEGP